MGNLKGSLIFAQSGGPTSVINASAYGVITEALKQSGSITDVYAAEYGIKGVLNDRLFDMRREDPTELAFLINTPSSAFGTCRYKLSDPDIDETDYLRISEIFKKYNVRYFIYNGGNDSMDTCGKIYRYLLSHGYECRVVGVPKTIDNDLYGTDHTPGYPSAAKYIATSLMEVNRDALVYGKGRICIFEIMGRNAGWLTAAASLGSVNGVDGADLIYLPELDFDMEKFLADVGRVYERKGNVFVAVSEGVRFADGSFVSEAKASSTDGFGHAQLGGLASILGRACEGRFGAKVRALELSLLQRCAAHSASGVDIEEAIRVGIKAVDAAVGGANGEMVAIERAYTDDGTYVSGLKLLKIAEVANFEKKFPREWINELGNGVTRDFASYALPLIQGDVTIPRENGLPRYAKLKLTPAAQPGE